MSTARLALCIMLCQHGIWAWRISGQGEQSLPSDDIISTNIQSRASGSFLWSPPPPINNEDIENVPNEDTGERRATILRQCTQTLQRPGVYKVRASSRSSSSFCYVLVKAPALQRIRFKFPQVQVDCQRSGLMLFDGWQLLDRKRPSIVDSIPPADQDDPETRKLYICTDNAALYRSLETSQNIGQILFFLHTGDEFTFQIEFLPDQEQVCNVYISRDDEPITLNIRVARPQNCPIYVSGAARFRLTVLRLDETDTDGPTCGTADTNFVSIQANSTTWNPSLSRRRFYHCDTDFSDFNTPCRFNIIQLHSISYAIQSATLEIDPLSDMDREPWSYYCY